MYALASDFDNTLYFSDIEGYYKPKDISAIKKFQQEGHLFGLCTGRPFIGALEPTQGIINFDFYIVTTGACIYDKHFNKIYSQCIDRSLIKSIYETFKDHAICLVQGNGYLYVFNPLHQRESSEYLCVPTPDDIDTDLIYGISLMTPNDPLKSKWIASEINRLYGDQIIAYQNVDSVDVVKKGCSKGHGIQFVKEYFHLDKIAAIGDSYNDIPMLQTADEAFTFLSSPKDVQSEANYLVSSIEETIHWLCPQSK